MHFVRCFVLLLVLPLALAACNKAVPSGKTSTDAPPAAVAGPVKTTPVSDLSADKTVRTGELANGMRYAITYNDQPEGQVSMRLVIHAGSLNEADDQRGLAHFIEHMAFNGSKDVPEGEMVKLLERRGLAFGADTNASTGYEYTTYKLDLPKNTDDLIDTGLFLFRETADRLSFIPAAIERERGVVFSEYRRGETPQHAVREASNQFLYPHALRTRRDPIGVPEVIKGAPRERFLDFYQHYYRPERAFLVVAGDFDVDDMEKRIKAKFADWKDTGPAGKAPDMGTIEKRPLEAASFQHEGVPTQINVVLTKKPVYEPDTVAARKKRVMHAIAGAIVNRRLGEARRKANAGFLGAFVSGQVATPDPQAISVNSYMGLVTQPASWRRGLIAVQEQLRKALQYGFTQAEIDEQVANMRTGLQNAAKQADSRWSAAIAAAIVRAEQSHLVYTSPKSAPARFEAVVPHLTPQNLTAALRQEWSGAAPQIFASSADAISEDDILAAWHEAQSAKITAPENKKTAEFAYTDFGPAGKIVWHNHVDDMDIDQARFANNVMVNIKHTDFEKGKVRVTLSLGAGQTSQPADKPGLFALADTALIAGGLEAHPIDDLSRTLAGHTVGLNFRIAEHTLQFAETTKPEDLTLQMQVLAAYLTHAAWREAPVQSFYNYLDTYYKTRSATPRSVASWAIPPLIHGGDNRWGLPVKEKMKALKVSDAHDWIGDILARAAIEISIVGDVDREKAMAAVAKTFGALSEREAKLRALDGGRPVHFPAAHGPISLTHEGKANLGSARTYWPTTDDSNARRARTGSLTRAVLALKLLDRVREQESGAYSPYAINVMSENLKGYGYLGVIMNVEPQKIKHFLDVADELATDMASGKISADEALRARKPILENIDKSRQSNAWWTGLLSQAQSRPDTLDRARTQKHDYQTITATDVAVFAKTYMQPARAWRVSTVPQDRPLSKSKKTESADE